MTHPEIARLIALERLNDAAAFALKLGDPHTASHLYERACEFALASDAALAAGDWARAVMLGVTSGDDAAAERALASLHDAPQRCAALGADLLARADFAWAARAFEVAGDSTAAASAWEHAGNAVRAAELHERAGEPVLAAKALEAALRADPLHAELNVALGGLLGRFGRHEAAVRALQKVAVGSAHRNDALALLVRELRALGMMEAATEAARELGLDVPPAIDPPALRLVSKQLLFGRYEVVREVASTATARVVECIDAVRAERVAVKIMSSVPSRDGGRDALVRFEREVKVLGALAHPNVVALRDYLPEGPAMVLAWMPGGTLEQMMTRPIAPARAIEVADALLCALGEAHRLGVLHRDVKPANVLFDEAGVAKLADFGVAHLSDLSVTATAGVIGTLAYMSPEQRAGKPATVQSDVYGVGVLLFEMLTGERIRVDHPARTKPSSVHGELGDAHDALVMRLFAREPAERPADAFEARKSLGSVAWPETLEPALPQSESLGSSRETPLAERARDGDGNGDGNGNGDTIEACTGQRLERVPLTDLSLARAGAFARAASRSLQVVLRVDRAAHAIWLAARRGARLDRPVTEREREQLKKTLGALHAEGCVHGYVDRAHIDLDEGELTLSITAAPNPDATPALDFAQLSRL